MAANSAQTIDALVRSLHEGRLHRIPRNPARRSIVLGVIASHFERRYPYSEPELNALLKETLTRCAADVDHVTCRRYLVDLGFVKRDRAGNRYFLNFPTLENTLDEAARQEATALVEQALAQGRERSRQRRTAL